MLQQKKLAIAVSVAIGASMAAMSTAQAYETLFFPHIVKSPTVSTVVSVINTSTVAVSAMPDLHYSLFYKDITEGNFATLEDPCEEYNVPLPTSPMDIQTFDISGYFGQEEGDLGVLFNDPSIKNNWRKANENFALAMNTYDGARGFLLVDDGDRITQGGGLAGEAFIFEFNEGAAWGYQAWSRTNRAAAVASSLNSAEAFNYLGAGTPVAGNFIPVLPLDEFATAFMVTPVGNEGSGQWDPDLEVTMQLRGLPPTADLYDRDEVPVSGKIPVDVVCVGRVDIQNLLSVASEARLVNGGWGSLELTDGAAVVYKLEYNLGNIFNGEDIGGLYNNAFQYNDQRLP